MLYDIRESRYMHMVMYCVMMLSTICMMSMMLGMPFIVGLVVFYLSAGFFSVYFTAGFMEIAPEMKHPGCWAGMGRAVNNFCALITVFITTRVEMGNGYYMMIAAVVLFVVISILLFLYQSPVKEKKSGEQEKQPLSVGNTDENISGTADDTGIDTERCPDSDDSFAAFCGKYGLTQREREVLQALVTSDKTAQEIAHEIGMSRAAFYRHIASLNEKTGTKARVGLYMESRQYGADAGVNQSDRVCETVVPYGQKKQGEYTLEDYYALPEDKRYELIDGVLYEMTAPTTLHQIIALQMCYQIEKFIEGKEGSCMTYIAPVDVQLDCDDKTMVEPDVIILCDRSKDINRCIYGAPDFVAEVLSKSTRRKDIGVKTYKYANAGVREYWMIDPKDMKVIVYTFAQNDDAEDTVSIFGFQDKIPVGIYNGELKIDFAKISKRLETNN